MRKADDVIPGAAATEIMLPQRPQDSIRFVKRSPVALNPNAQHFVSLDQYTGAILKVDRYEELSWGATMRLLVYPSHGISSVVAEADAIARFGSSLDSYSRSAAARLVLMIQLDLVGFQGLEETLMPRQSEEFMADWRWMAYRNQCG
jgi:hypothetical protein